MSDTVYPGGMTAKRRIRPRLTITVDPEVYRQLHEVRDLLPGSSLSGIVSELLEVSLPVFEGVVDTLKEARDDDGQLDEARARDALARWAGAQLLGLSDTFGAEPGKEGD